ncbi:MAG: lipid A biosynthesis acyltransferase [Halofilum sp. (in: g-proteobacteria)]
MSVPPRELLHPRHWPSWLGLGLLSLGLLLPRRWRDRLAARAGDRQYRRNARRRETVELNLACCFPDWPAGEREALARAYFRAFARAMADQPLFWWDRNGTRISAICRLHGLDHLQRARADGRPVILLGPHITGIAFGGVALARHAGLSTMANRYDDPVLQWVEHRSRLRHGPVFLREDGIRPVIRELRAGGVFYYMPDEDLGPRDSVFAPFFGMQKATLTALGRLARLARATVLPMMVFYDTERCRYEVELRPPLPGFPSGDDEADARAMNAALEESIRRCPEQYLWNQRMFRSRPDGSRMAYPKRARGR